MSAPGIPWRTWTPEAAAELRAGVVFLAWAAGVPWLLRWSVFQNRLVLVEGGMAFEGGDIEAVAWINPPASAEPEWLLPVRLVPLGHPVGDAP